MTPHEGVGGHGSTIRILHVFARLNCGGAEKRTLELVRYWATHPAEVPLRTDFCCLSGLPGVFDAEACKWGCQVHYLALRSPGFFRRFRRLLETGGYHVLHSHVHYPSGLLTFLAQRSGVPVRVVHFRSTEDGRGRTSWRRLMTFLGKTLIAHSATHIVAVSRAAMEAAWGQRWLEDPRCRVIYNGLDLRQFPNPDDPTLRQRLLQAASLKEPCRIVIHVGRESPPKNHLRLLEIFSELRRHDETSRLILIGQFTQNSQVCGEIAQKNLHHCVRILGHRDDVPALLAGADVMLFPSLWEGLPGAVLESLAVGTPVVASDIPAHREIAEYLPELLRLLPLETSNTEWARQILGLARPTSCTREDARRRFMASPFWLPLAAEAVYAIYRSAFGQSATDAVPRNESSANSGLAKPVRRAA